MEWEWVWAREGNAFMELVLAICQDTELWPALDILLHDQELDLGTTGQRAKQQKPGAPAAELGGPKMANLGHAVQDLKKEKSISLGPSYADRNVRPEMPNMRRGNILTAPESQVETGFGPAALPHGKLNPLVKASSPLDKQSKGFGLGVSPPQGGERYDPTLLERRGTALATGGVRHQLPLVKDNIKSLSSASAQVQTARDYDSFIQHNQQNPNCGSNQDLLHALGISHHELLGSETQSNRGLLHQAQIGKDSKHLVRANPQAQEETTYQRPISQNQDGRDNIFSLQQGQGSRGHLSAVANGQGVKELGLGDKDKNKPRIRGALAVENHSRGSLNVRAQGSHSLGITLIEGQEAEGFTADGQKSKHLSHAEHDATESKSLGIPGQTGRNDQATSYMGGAGNDLGASLGTGGYGAGLGQGAYFGGAAGKLGAAAAAALGQGYGEGATGHLGAMAGNGYGYGNGYSDGHRAGGYAGQVQGGYGALGGGLDQTGGKFGDGGYPYPAQQLNLGAEGAKTANKYGAAGGYVPQQTGYGAQLGATQDILGEQAGKYDGGNAALGNGYKG
ncbi:spidroin-1 isoform X2 [Eleginops maclovinus]|uniref:spidroin-1 isoform X2 n=1 Tax=Eleginops maclovinus TaxID=56733 RepID=UPI003080D22C